MAAAAKAVELGYGIEADPGPSGRLGGWAIAGIPKEAWEVHATRSAQIDAAVGPDASYRARSWRPAATRDRKSHEPVEDLMRRWRAELARGRLPAAELAAAVDRAGAPYAPPDDVVIDALPRCLPPVAAWPRRRFSTGGRESWRSPRYLHGLPVSVLDRAVDGCLPTTGRAPAAGGRRPGAGVGRRLRARRRAPHRRAGRRGSPAVAAAGRRRALQLRPSARAGPGHASERRQAEVAEGLLTSGHCLDLVVGVAGSGKTTRFRRCGPGSRRPATP